MRVGELEANNRNEDLSAGEYDVGEKLPANTGHGAEIGCELTLFPSHRFRELHQFGEIGRHLRIRDINIGPKLVDGGLLFCTSAGHRIDRRG